MVCAVGQQYALACIGLVPAHAQAVVAGRCAGWNAEGVFIDNLLAGLPLRRGVAAPYGQVVPAGAGEAIGSGQMHKHGVGFGGWGSGLPVKR